MLAAARNLPQYRCVYCCAPADAVVLTVSRDNVRLSTCVSIPMT